MEQKTTQSSMRRTNMYFTTPQMDKLSRLSDETGLSVAELVRRAVDDYLKRSAVGKPVKPHKPGSAGKPEKVAVTQAA